MKNYYKIFIALITSIIFFLVSQFNFTIVQSAFIAVLVLLIILWTNNRLPMGIVPLFPLLLFH